jgi:hypothetical protein
MQHPDNVIVAPVKNTALYIIAIYLVKNGDDLEKTTKEEIKVLRKKDSTTYRINKTCEGLKDVFVYGRIENNFNSLKSTYTI